MRKILKKDCKMMNSNIYDRFFIFVFLVLLIFTPTPCLFAQDEFSGKESQAEVYSTRGWNLLKEGKMDEAILNYEKAIELNPSFAQAYGDLGIIFEVKGQMNKAEEMYLKAIEVAPDYLNSYSNLALLYEKQGNYTKAIGYWKRRLDLSQPSDPYIEVANKRLDELMHLHPQVQVPLKSKNDKPVKELTDVRADNNELIMQLNSLKGLNKQLKAKIADLENISQNVQAKEKDISKLKNTIQNMEQELSASRNENKDLQERLEQESITFKKESAALKQKASLNEGTIKEAEKLKQEKFILTTELSKQKEFNSDLGEKSKAIEEEVNKLKDNAENINQERISLDKENKQLQEKIALLENTAKEIAKLRQENSDLTKALEKLKNSLPQITELETKVQNLSVQVKDTEQMDEAIQDLNNKLASANQEKFTLIKEKEELRLKADTYMRSKEDLEKEFMAEITKLKRFNEQLEFKKKEFYIKTLGVDQTKKNLNTLNKVVDRMNQDQVKYKTKNEELQKKIVSLESSLKKERAKLYEELGTAYTKAKLFNMAIQAYEESLTFNPNNAEAHYNLGLLYKHYLDNSKKAMLHLKKYLELNSKTANRKEVEYLIGMLGDKKF